jgi:hypothetical protein
MEGSWEFHKTLGGSHVATQLLASGVGLSVLSVLSSIELVTGYS